MRRLLVVGPFPWRDLGLSPTEWPDCESVESSGDADALRRLRNEAFDVLVTHPHTPARADLALAKEARYHQPGVRPIVLAPELAAHDIIKALREDVYACFTIPADVDELRATILAAPDASQWRNGIEVQSAVPGWIALRVSCRRVTAERLTRFMTELAGDLADSERYKLIAAFREILLNAMEHGAGFDEGKVVDIAAVRTQRTIVYYFKDPGVGFNPHDPPLTATETDPLGHIIERSERGIRPGGFGMLLTRKLVDEIHYNELGNEVFLVKHLT
jgi:anti-sigma regulatory factor (Ser/Thr protein kinase)